MKLPVRAWSGVLSNLGYQRSRKPTKGERRKARRCQLESLEDRRMMVVSHYSFIGSSPIYYGCQSSDLQASSGATGGDPSPLAISPAGVEYGNGVVALTAPGMSQANYGTMFGQTPVWTNAPQTSSGMMGDGMAVAQLPKLEFPTGFGHVTVVDGTVTESFNQVGSTYVADNFSQDSLTYDGANNHYILNTSAGQTLIFYSFSSSLPTAEQGTLVSAQDADGSLAQVTSVNSDYNPLIVTISSSDTSVVEKYAYTYYTSGSNLGMLQYVTLLRSTDGGSTFPTTIQQAEYDYYGTGDPNGAPHELQFAKIEDGGGTVLDTTYYRWYTSTGSGAYSGSVKLMFNNDSWTRLLAANSGSVSTVEGLSDSAVAPYANDYLQYDSHDRVTQITLSGAGCSVCASGLGTYQYSYLAVTGTFTSTSSWADETVETLPDGSTNDVYTNFYGETLLSRHVAGSLEWDTAYKYDSAGRLTEVDSPSAVASYSATASTGSLSVSLNSSAGLIYVTDYASSTTASSSTAGNINGYVVDHAIKNGSLGSTVYLDSTQYYQFTSGSASISPIATSTQYAAVTSTLYTSGTPPTGDEVTTFAYSLYSSSVAIKEIDETLPAVTDEGTGVGGSDTISTMLDAHGRPAWQKTARGIINYFHYDEVTGSLLESIQDVYTSASGISSLPHYSLLSAAGWTTSSGLGLTSVNILDLLGRPVIAIDPNNDVTFTVYDDPGHSVRVYTGWIYTPGTGGVGNLANYAQDTRSTLPPVQVEIDDLAAVPTSGYTGSYSQMLTMTQPTAGSGTTITENGVTLPIGGHTVSSVQVLDSVSSVQSLSVAIQNQAGQTIETDDYYDLTAGSWTYSAGTSPYIGTAWDPTSPGTAANYYRTAYAYDNEGELNKTVTPNGTIYRTVHDTLGRVSSTWIGGNGWATTPDDHPSSSYWSTSNPASMQLVTARIYDSGGVGDSNLTETVAFPLGMSSAAGTLQVTETTYDWRDRPVNTKRGVLVTEPTTSGSGAVFVPGLSEQTGGAARWVLDNPTAETDDTQRPVVHTLYNNLDDVVERRVYSGNTVLLSNVSDSGVSTAGSDSLVRSDVVYTLDNRERVSSVTTDDVNQSTGAITSGTSRTTSSQFDADDNVTQSTDARSNVTTYAFDGADRLTTETLPAPTTGGTNPILAFYYDNDGRLTSSTDANSNTTSHGYDAAGRKLFDRQPYSTSGSGTGGPQTNYAYNAAGWLSTVTSPLSEVTTYSYDALGRKVSVAAPSITVSGSSVTPTTTWTYDGDNNVASEADPSSYTTSYTYSLLDQVATTSQTVALASGSSTTAGITNYHDNLGRLTETIDGEAHVITYAYNVLNQRTQEQWFTSTSTMSSSINEFDYSYDALGDLVSAKDSGNKYTYTFDSFGQSLTVDNHGNETGGTSGVPRVVLTSVYDKNGNRPYFWANIGSGTGTGDFSDSMSYDNLNRLTSVTRLQQSTSDVVDSQSATFSYDLGSRLVGITETGAWATGGGSGGGSGSGSSGSGAGSGYMSGAFSFDRADRLTSVTWYGTGGPFSSASGTGTSTGSAGYYDYLQYTYDNDSQVSAVSQPNYPSESLSYGYDADGQLNTGTDTTGSLTNFSESHDGNGNIVGQSIGAGNRLLGDGIYSYTYDKNGNLKSRATSTTETDYDWDIRNRLTSVADYTVSGGTKTKTREIDYSYDVFNNLQGRTLSYYSGGSVYSSQTDRFVYDGKRVMLAFNGSGCLTNRYLWGPLVDQVLSNEQLMPFTTSSYTLSALPTSGGALSWLLSDGQNTVHDIVISGHLADHISYDGYGQIRSQSNSSYVDWFGYTGGGWTDLLTGFVYHNDPSTGKPGRWYNPSTQRWLSPDPIFPDSGPNPYEYCDNSPVNAVDPSGLVVTVSKEQHSVVQTYFGTGNVTFKSTDQGDRVVLGADAYSHFANYPGDEGYKAFLLGAIGDDRTRTLEQANVDYVSSRYAEHKSDPYGLTIVNLPHRGGRYINANHELVPNHPSDTPNIGPLFIASLTPGIACNPELIGALQEIVANYERKPKWNLGSAKSAQQWRNRMEKRGWTPEQIDQAINSGERFNAPNNINPGNGATRYVHPQTGRSVVIDNKTGEVMHVGGDGFDY